MSTRCQMGIYANDTMSIKSAEVFIYRHSDGYPGTEYGVVNCILPFLKWFNKERGIDDREYCAARLLQHLTNVGDHIPSKSEYTVGTTGFGVDTQLHGDIEYFYHISPAKLKVYEVHGKTTAAWKLVEEHSLVAVA